MKAGDPRILRIFMHDFVGHPFIFQLSREFARRGHSVLHVHYGDFVGPKASFQVPESQVASLTVRAVSTGGLHKYSLVRRFIAHRRYEKKVRRLMEVFRPDCVISGNTPTDVQNALIRCSGHCGAVFVHWVQDFYSAALETVFAMKFGPLGRLLAQPFHRAERENFQRSDWVVYITPDFATYAASHGYRPRRETVIENWAPLEEIPLLPKDNPWSRKNGLNSRFVFLYSGTMGLKHNPRVLVELAQKFRNRPDVAIVVVSEGLGRQFLEEQKKRRGLINLHLFDFQPFTELPSVLASADVFVTTLEEESSIFCAPSKVLSYCCAGRSQLLLAPSSNLIVRTIGKAGAGFTFAPGDLPGFLEAAETLLNDDELRCRLGRSARQYAEVAFDVRTIADRFTDMVAPLCTDVRGAGDRALRDGASTHR